MLLLMHFKVLGNGIHTLMGYHGIMHKRTFKNIFEVNEGYIPLHHGASKLWYGINSLFSGLKYEM